MSCGVGCRRGSDPALLCLWRSPVATALIQPLAWESPYAAVSVQEIVTTTTTTTKTKDKKKKKKNPTAAALTSVQAWVESPAPQSVLKDPVSLQLWRSSVAVAWIQG